MTHNPSFVILAFTKSKFLSFALDDPANTLTTAWEYEDRDEDGVPEHGSLYDPANHVAKGYGYWLYVESLSNIILRIPHREIVELGFRDGSSAGKQLWGASSDVAIQAISQVPPPTPPGALHADGPTGTAAGGLFLVRDKQRR
ncbi:hypothetical protein ACFL0Q_07790 [Thermodesulfobacteriota bacterium]